MTREEILAEVTADIDLFIRRVKVRLPQWRRNIKAYHGHPEANRSLTQRDVRSNLVFGLARTVIPSVYHRNPYVVARSRVGEPRELVKFNEMLLNFQLEVMRIEPEMRRIIFDVLFRGVAIGKVGVVADDAKGSVPSATAQQLLQATVLAGQMAAPPAPKGEPERSREFEEKVDYEESISPNRPYFTRVPIHHFAVDRYATRIDNASWCAHRLLKPLEWVQRNPDWPKKITENIQATWSESAFDEEFTWNIDGVYNQGRDRAQGGRRESELVEIWEIWHKPTREVITLGGTSPDQILQTRDWPYDFNDFPFEDLRFNEDPDSFFGVEDVTTWESLVAGINWLQSRQLVHVNRFNRKYISDLTNEEKEGFEEQITSEQDGTIVYAPGGAESVKALQDAPITGDLYALNDTLRNDLTMISGVTYQRQGFKQKGEATATEVSYLESHAQLRDIDRVGETSKFMNRMVKKIHALNRQMFQAGDYWFSNYSDELGKLMQQVGPLLAVANIDVAVRVGTSAFRTKDVRTKQLLDFWNLTANMVDTSKVMEGFPPLPLLNHRAMFLRIAELMDIDSPEELLSPDPGYPQPFSGGSQQVPRGATPEPPTGDQGRVQNLGARPSKRPVGAKP